MIEATDATVGTSLKNKSLRSSKKTQILSEKNCETRKTIKKRKESLQIFIIFYNSLVDYFGNYEKDKDLYYLSLEEIGIRESFHSFMEMYSFIKNSKVRYRVSLDDIDSSRVFRKFFIKLPIKSYIEILSFFIP